MCAYRLTDWARVATLCTTQGMANSLKEELKEMLLDRGITSFSMVPVKRSYGFERRDVPRGEQYVIKVRVPASAPALPSDLSGRHFKCLFGTQVRLGFM